MTEDARTKCSHCGEPATLKCSSCKIHVYCGTDCQKPDWARHKTTCKEITLERTIERCADTLQRAYLDFREITYDNHIAKVEVKDDRVLIYDGPIEMKKSGVFAGFPNHLVTEKNVKMAMLCFLMCNEPIALVFKMLSKLLIRKSTFSLISLADPLSSQPEDLKVKIEEVSVKFQSVPRKTIVVCVNGYEQSNFPAYNHEILRVSSVKSGKKWAIDLAGGQYGLCQPCWKWEEYEKSYVERVVKVHKLGANQKYINACSQVEGIPSLTYGPAQGVASHLNAAFDKWIESLPAELPKILILDDEKFKYHQDCLLKGMNVVVRNFVDNSNYTSKVQIAAKYEVDNPGVSSQKVRDIGRAFMQAGSPSTPTSNNDIDVEQIRQMLGGNLNLDIRTNF